jgi:hypothetical protein
MSGFDSEFLVCRPSRLEATVSSTRSKLTALAVAVAVALQTTRLEFSSVTQLRFTANFFVPSSFYPTLFTVLLSPSHSSLLSSVFGSLSSFLFLCPFHTSLPSTPSSYQPCWAPSHRPSSLIPFPSFYLLLTPLSSVFGSLSSFLFWDPSPFFFLLCLFLGLFLCPSQLSLPSRPFSSQTSLVAPHSHSSSRLFSPLLAFCLINLSRLLLLIGLLSYSSSFPLLTSLSISFPTALLACIHFRPSPHPPSVSLILLFGPLFDAPTPLFISIHLLTSSLTSPFSPLFLPQSFSFLSLFSLL